MKPNTYRAQYRRPRHTKRRTILFSIVGVLLVVAVAVGLYAYFGQTPVEKAVSQLQFDASVSEAEKQAIRQAVQDQQKTYEGTVSVGVQTALEATNISSVLAAYVPVVDVYDTRQAVTQAELAGVDVYVPADMDDTVRNSLATTLGLESAELRALTGDVPDNAVAFVAPDKLSPDLKLLAFEGAYYLDTFKSGGVFRQIGFSGSGATGLGGLVLNSYPTKDTTLKVNMTGVTALTRVMIRKLNEVGDAKYFSQKISAFLADADITHVSNEVSFKEGCTFHNALFCSPPKMIDALKESGVDLVELTGNHNNDVGKQFNTDTINLYHSLGWQTFGGGLNAVEAAKPFVADQKGSKITFLGYNQADGPTSGAIATTSAAGANLYSADKARADIAAAKEQGHFVIVDVQFSECYAYPGGYTEFPECDRPIAGQKEAFRRYIDMGADMVIGSSAHQPQTYELYNGKPIYYGLGNMYFDQVQQPGTERGIILTHYFVGGKLLQTKLSPTVFGKSLQTQLMDSDDAAFLLKRLKAAR